MVTVMCVCVLLTVDTDLDHSQLKKIKGLLDTLQSNVVCVNYVIQYDVMCHVHTYTC